VSLHVCNDLPPRAWTVQASRVWQAMTQWKQYQAQPFGGSGTVRDRAAEDGGQGRCGHARCGLERCCGLECEVRTLPRPPRRGDSCGRQGCCGVERCEGFRRAAQGPSTKQLLGCSLPAEFEVVALLLACRHVAVARRRVHTVGRASRCQAAGAGGE
jgi:hypothetical protein